MNRSSRQSGSAIILIFIAVAIFGALSFAVMRGGAGSMQTLTDEQATLAANEIIAYGDALAKAVQTLKLRGCSDTQFDFANTTWVNSDNTQTMAIGHNSTAVSGCGVFKTGEGNSQPIVFARNYFVDATTGQINFGSAIIRSVVLPGIGTSAADMAYFLPHISDTVCLKINSLLAVPPENAIPTHTATGAKTAYNGDYSISYTVNDTNGTLTGKSAFCSLEPAGINDNRFYKVLIAR